MILSGIATLILAETLLSLSLFAAAVAILVFLLRRPLRKYKRVDMAVFEWLRPTITPFNNQFMSGITFLGKHQFLIPANLLLILYFILIAHEGWFSIRIITISLSSLVLMFLLKAIFRRKRPLSPLLQAAKGLSFPSGHAIMAVTFYGLLFYICRHTINNGVMQWFVNAFLIALIILIGYSRVYLRVHYASDVIAGFVIGFLWLLISLTVLHHLETDYRTKLLSQWIPAHDINVSAFCFLL